jgi:hypothetical protein
VAGDFQSDKFLTLMDRTLLYVVILMLIHLFAHRLEALPLSKGVWLSFGGGISVAFVFIHLLPELHDWQLKLDERKAIPAFIGHQFLYLFTMIGVLAFYALEKAIIYFNEKKESKEKAVDDGIYFWHLGIFAFYNAIFGYIFHEDQEIKSFTSPLIFTAIAFHFVTNDYGMQHHHEKAYQKSGRWVMAGAVLVGWLLALIGPLPDLILASLFAFLTGGIVINILKEEMHEEKENHLGAFLLGALVFSVMFLV